MLLNAIGKLMFPHLERWQRRRHVRTIFITLVLGAVVAAAFAGFLFWQETHPR